MTPVQTNRSGDASRAPRAINSSAADRRQRLHLRELCDEVLASWRTAQGRELFSEEDRRMGRAMVMQLVGR